MHALDLAVVDLAAKDVLESGGIAGCVASVHLEPDIVELFLKLVHGIGAHRRVFDEPLEGEDHDRGIANSFDEGALFPALLTGDPLRDAGLCSVVVQEFSKCIVGGARPYIVGQLVKKGDAGGVMRAALRAALEIQTVVIAGA